jgi:hypothetical protein
LPLPGELSGTEAEFERKEKGSGDVIEEKPDWQRLEREMDFPEGMPVSLDRSVIDRGMGNEMSGKLEGGAKLTVDVSAPRGTEATAEVSDGGILSSAEVNRQMPMEE